MDKAQLGRNEALFREVNEAIAATSTRTAATEAGFVCECGDATCTHRVTADLAEYERIREHPTRFLLQPGHEDRRVERVVHETKRYAVVEKFEQTVESVVRRRDPRTRTASA